MMRQTAMEENNKGISVLELCRRIEDVVNGSDVLCDVWVVGETSDLSVKGGNCYFELVQKDDAGRTEARIAARIWRSAFAAVSATFVRGTGSVLASGMKVLVKCDVRYSAAYGMSVTVKAVDPSYTLGEAVRRRREIISRLQAEGLTDLQRRLRFPLPCLRVAIISGAGAAGYGDFRKHIAESVPPFAFRLGLFRASVQGERTVPEVMAALDRIVAEAENWDCVVIIRGGGSTTDLAAFDSYELAARIASFPLPVLVGIGHERDETVLDFVSYQHCKTPTAVAQLIIDRNLLLYQQFGKAAQLIYNTVRGRIADCAAELARLESAAQSEIRNFTVKRRGMVDLLASRVQAAAMTLITRDLGMLDRYTAAIQPAVANTLRRNAAEVDSLGAQLRLLSPAATLQRGFSLSVNADGYAVTDASTLSEGDTVTTYTAAGAFDATVTKVNPSTNII